MRPHSRNLLPLGWSLRCVKARLLLEGERAKSEKPEITDRKDREAQDSARRLMDTPEGRESIREQADRDRFGDRAEQGRAAVAYLELGLKLAELLPASTDAAEPNESISAAHAFHYAGHCFRDVGKLNRAADAYWRAGVVEATSDCPDYQFACRSLARAKMCYAEVGEIDESDQMHALEWDTRRRGLKCKCAQRDAGRRHSTLVLTLWDATSRYGTNFKRWLTWLLGLLFLYTLVYQVLESTGALSSPHGWTFVVTAIYMAVTTSATVTFGNVLPNGWVAQLVVSVNAIVMYGLLAVGVTVLGRRVLQR